MEEMLDEDEARIAAALADYDEEEDEDAAQGGQDPIAAACARAAAEIEAGIRRGQPASQPRPPAAPLDFIDPTQLGDAAPVERRWIVEGWLPAGTVTLLYSAGGEGKSLLALQLATACATGRQWLGIQPERCRAMVVMCEDDTDELHRRQRAINAELRTSMRDLADMRWASPVGADNTLVRFERDGAPVWTDRFREIEAAAAGFRPGLIVLDTAADLYGGNENDRGQVSQFLKTGLGGLARDTGAAVLLLAHPSRSGLASGDLDGGSTAWSGAVRSRWSLATPKGKDGTTPDPLVRELVRRKSNYAPRGEAITMRFCGGAMRRVELPAQGAGETVGGVPLGTAFLSRLAAAEQSGDWVSPAQSSPRYAPKVFSAQGGGSVGEFKRAMEHLIEEGIIFAADAGTSSKPRRELRRHAPSSSEMPASDDEGYPF